MQNKLLQFWYDMKITLPYFKLLVCRDNEPSENMFCTSALIRSPSCKCFLIICSSSADLRRYVCLFYLCNLVKHSIASEICCTVSCLNTCNKTSDSDHVKYGHLYSGEGWLKSKYSPVFDPLICKNFLKFSSCSTELEETSTFK